jgi:mono/diheme cytochrome c family protein
MLSTRVLADNTQVARGEYLVRFGGCNDCHTPGYFAGKPDASRLRGTSRRALRLVASVCRLAAGTAVLNAGLHRQARSRAASSPDFKRPSARRLRCARAWPASRGC